MKLKKNTHTILKINEVKLGLVAYIYNFITGEAEAEDHHEF